MKYNLYSQEELGYLQEAGIIAKSIMQELLDNAKVGNTTRELDRLAEARITEKGCLPLFKGYEGFPYSLCLSKNEHIVHGFPDDIPLKKGEVLSIDLGLRYKGYCSDHARTLIIEDEFSPYKELVGLGEESFRATLPYLYPEQTTGTIGFYINYTVMQLFNTPRNWTSGSKYKVYSNFQGHGIGKNLHEPPPVPNFGKKGAGEVLKEGMCICIEPVILHRSSNVLVHDVNGVNQFTTHDKLPSAHYENQVYIAGDGPIHLTL